MSETVPGWLQEATDGTDVQRIAAALPYGEIDVDPAPEPPSAPEAPPSEVPAPAAPDAPAPSEVDDPVAEKEPAS